VATLQWLPWTDAAGMAAAAGVATPVLGARASRALRAAAAWSGELAVMLALYALWQLAGSLSLGGAAGAVKRGADIYRAERALDLPSEAALQRIFLGQHWLLRGFNLYYVGLHVAVTGAVIVWVFARHRDAYPVIRNTLALATAACLMVALIPVAPPRLVPGLGLVDTGRLVGPTVYPATDQPGLDQLSAMPSVHVAWALVAAIAVIYATHHRWRWAALLYPLATLTVVVVTGNHYWADGAAAALLVAGAYALSRRLAGRHQPALSRGRPPAASHPGRDLPQESPVGAEVGAAPVGEA
jgi:hypothetical protein